MVTLAFIVCTCLSILLMSYIDTHLYGFSLFEAIYYIVYPERATREVFVVFALIVGFISSLMIDYRHRKNTQTVSK
ncbi:hypothetical protein JOC85_004064 [Bacillus mesophilus]|nr:hypothetical protein [Bacillus mesophilus]